VELFIISFCIGSFKGEGWLQRKWQGENSFSSCHLKHLDIQLNILPDKLTSR
jgi:hypothetical protein